jgi:hypothetical protein
VLQSAETAIEANASAISQEVSDRAAAVTALTNGAVASNTAAINQEVTDRAAAITALTNGAVATNASGVSTNAAAITSLTNGAVATNASAIATLTSGLASEESARLAAEADKMDVAGGTFTGPVSFNEDVIAKGGASGSGAITLNCELNSHGVKIQGPAHSANASYTLVLPPNTGNAGEVLTTDGSGSMTWQNTTLSLSSLPVLP